MSFEQVNSEGDEIESLPWMMDHSAGPEERYDSVELHDALQHCVKALNSEYRLVVVLVDVEGMSYEEVARVANIPVGTVKSRLARARMQGYEVELTYAQGVKAPGGAGYRLIANAGASGMQEVPHMHVHIVGGRALGRMLPG